MGSLIVFRPSLQESSSVTGKPHLLCPKCNEEVLGLNEYRRLRERASEKYREKYKLLAGEEIKQLRERLGLTQGQLADLLRLFPVGNPVAMSSRRRWISCCGQCEMFRKSELSKKAGCLIKSSSSKLKE